MKPLQSNETSVENTENGATKPEAVTDAHGKYGIHCLTIIGQIEGHYTLGDNSKTTRYESVIPQLIAVEEEKNIKGLLIILNTVGGDVEAGLALAELIAGMKKPTVSLVLGGGHSIGVPLAVSSKYSFIVPSASMTLHPVRLNGQMLGVPQTMDYFNKIQNRITEFILRHSKMKKTVFNKLINNTTQLVTDIGTVLDGEEAVRYGLIDELGSLSDAISKLYELIEKNEKIQE